ncbi:MAG: class I SAM-dependent methyltransferase [Chloroflexota bacterium]|nr:class I SAM-dependent methyltransferase [Chloroflexota bacterium]
MEYNPRTYWTEVADRIQARGSQSLVAGDDTPFYRYKRARFLEEFTKIDFRDKSVLEVGCGPGGNLEIVHSATPKRLVGCDISQKMIDLATQNLQAVLPSVELILTDGVTLPLEDKSMDITYTVTVLQHNTDEEMLANLVREICRVTRGKTFLFEDTSDRIKSGASWTVRPVSYYQTIMEKHGFKLTQVEYISVLANRLTSAVILKLMSPGNRKEGEAIPPMAVACQRACLPLTRLLDRILTERRGLTKMLFEQKTQL